MELLVVDSVVSYDKEIITHHVRSTRKVIFSDVSVLLTTGGG